MHLPRQNERAIQPVATIALSRPCKIEDDHTTPAADRYFQILYKQYQQTMTHVGESFIPCFGSWKNMNGHGQRSIIPLCFSGASPVDANNSSSSVGGFVKNTALMMLIMSVDTNRRPVWPKSPSVVADESSGVRAKRLVGNLLLCSGPTTDWVNPAASSVSSRFHSAYPRSLRRISSPDDALI